MPSLIMKTSAVASQWRHYKKQTTSEQKEKGGISTTSKQWFTEEEGPEGKQPKDECWEYVANVRNAKKDKTYPVRWTQTELIQVFEWNKGVSVTYAFPHVHTVKCGENCRCSNVKSMQREGRMNAKCLVPAIDFQSLQMEVYPVEPSHNQVFNI